MLLQNGLLLLRAPLFLISFTALVSLLLSASIFQQQQRDLLDIRNAHYGKALATLAASQATDATLNHDLVSLQVTMRDVANNPDVINTTIHDVENQLLVQAGTPPVNRGFLSLHSRSYSAPITFQDSIAGYVTVTLNTQSLHEQQQDTWLVGLIGLSIALIILSILNLRKKPDAAEESEERKQEKLEKETEENPSLPTRRQATSSAVVIELSLLCLNRHQLEQQLSSSLRQKLQADLERYLSGINTIYSGQIIAADQQVIGLEFHGDELENTAFRAICAAQLLFKLLQPNNSGIQLKFAAAAVQISKQSSLSAHINRAKLRQHQLKLLEQSSDKELLLDTESCATSQLSQRLQCEDSLLQDTWLVIKGLHSGYQGLIDKQAIQLQQLQNQT